jgi:hypothetical protein
MRALRILIVLLIFLCLIPPLSLIAAGLVARWAGCQLDPDVPVSCTILGGDYGDPLFAVANFGWLSVGTLPILAALLVAWILIEIVRAMGKSRRPRDRQAPTTSRNRARGS